MKSRASLVLLELTVMLLVLAVAAAACLQVFAWAQLRSAENEARDLALVELQNAAQVLQHCGGDFRAAADLHGGSWDGTQWQIPGESWSIRAVAVETGSALLGGAVLETVGEGAPALALTVYWQEAAYGT